MLPAFARIKWPTSNNDDDAIDRLNYVYTQAIISFFLVIIGGNQFIGEFPHCLMPAEFKYSWQGIIDSFCSVENTYFVNETQPFPQGKERKEHEVYYYQWVTSLLVVQILFLVLPKIWLNAVSFKSGLQIKGVIKSIFKRKDFCASHSKKLRQILLFNYHRKQSWYFTIVYLCYKFFNCINSIFQLWFMNNMINTNYKYYGYEVLRDLLLKRDWRSSGHFPRVTFCDFIRRDDTSSRPMTFTVQCLLNMNMFYEKIFIFLWFLFVALTIANVLNFIYWTIISSTDACKIHFIRAQLNIALADYDNDVIPNFVSYFITTDGITVLRLISENCGEETSSDIIFAMYFYFQREKKSKDAELNTNEIETDSNVSS